MNAVLRLNAVASATTRLLFTAGFIACACGTQAQTNIPLVPMGAVWKYLDTGVDQGTAWIAPAFNDSAWPSGPAQLGYGDGDEATPGYVVQPRLVGDGSRTNVVLQFDGAANQSYAIQYTEILLPSANWLPLCGIGPLVTNTRT